MKVVTVLFNRIDVDTEDFLKFAAKNSMRSVFALEHAFMQVGDVALKVEQGFLCSIDIQESGCLPQSRFKNGASPKGVDHAMPYFGCPVADKNRFPLYHLLCPS